MIATTLTQTNSVFLQYALSLIFGLLNLIAVCRPSTFRNDFHWNAQPDDLYQPDGSLTPLFCEGAPMLKQSYWGSLALTIVIYVTNLAVSGAAVL